jgi:hypothetical protein
MNMLKIIITEMLMKYPDFKVKEIPLFYRVPTSLLLKI